MDQVIHRVLRFDRFALDLTRGCLRVGERDIDLRPKAFDVLRHLAESAGRLVSKQELFDAVWPDVTVTDDSLVQCIRELREKLGDDEHRLIKTVPRRGYLLEATLAAPPLVPEPQFASKESLAPGAAPAAAVGPAPNGSGRNSRARHWGTWGALAVGILGLVFGIVYLAGPPASAVRPDLPKIVKSALVPPLRSFKDCDICSEMVELPPGEFVMGSPETENGRDHTEGPQRLVVLKQRVAIAKHEVTIDQFTAFVEDTGYKKHDQCRARVPGGELAGWPYTKVSFREPGYNVTGMHPVTCVTWMDAKAYTEWLAKKTGRPYRLPTEAEWEYAARAGTRGPFSFGDDPAKLCAYARFADEDSNWPWGSSCHSGTTQPGAFHVGALTPNPWGLFDMHGNVWEWTEDCWILDARSMPVDGSAMTRPDCGWHTIRGGGWANDRKRLRSASRIGQPAETLYYHVGLRVVLPLAAN